MTIPLPALCDHWNNPTGALLVEVDTGIACSPIDPISPGSSLLQEYPTEKPYRLKQAFTLYTAFQPQDRLISGGVTYTVQTAHFYAAQDGMEAYYHILLEEKG